MGIDFRSGNYVRRVKCGKRTIKDGEGCVIWNINGQHREIHGPKREFLWFSTIRFLHHFIVNEHEYLIIKYMNGVIENKRGPLRMFMNPVKHASMEKHSAIRLKNENDCIVVYSEVEINNNNKQEHFTTVEDNENVSFSSLDSNTVSTLPVKDDKIHLLEMNKQKKNNNNVNNKNVNKSTTTVESKQSEETNNKMMIRRIITGPLLYVPTNKDEIHSFKAEKPLSSFESASTKTNQHNSPIKSPISSSLLSSANVNNANNKRTEEQQIIRLGKRKMNLKKIFTTSDKLNAEIEITILADLMNVNQFIDNIPQDKTIEDCFLDALTSDMTVLGSQVESNDLSLTLMEKLSSSSSSSSSKKKDEDENENENENENGNESKFTFKNLISQAERIGFQITDINYVDFIPLTNLQQHYDLEMKLEMQLRSDIAKTEQKRKLNEIDLMNKNNSMNDYYENEKQQQDLELQMKSEKQNLDQQMKKKEQEQNLKMSLELFEQKKQIDEMKQQHLLNMRKQENDFIAEQRERKQNEYMNFLKELHGNGVDLTKYLCYQKDLSIQQQKKKKSVKFSDIIEDIDEEKDVFELESDEDLFN